MSKLVTDVTPPSSTFHFKNTLHHLEYEFLQLTIFPDNQKERMAYNSRAQIISELNTVYALTLFKCMLRKRLNDFDFVLDLELDII
jgi:hypothetical protein